MPLLGINVLGVDLGNLVAQAPIANQVVVPKPIETLIIAIPKAVDRADGVKQVVAKCNEWFGNTNYRISNLRAMHTMKTPENEETWLFTVEVTVVT